MAETRWKELGDFLKARRARRARLRPEDFGLDSGASRRVPGLRRAEVADLISISTDYYTRLEQGRMAAPAPILAALAQALNLSQDHRAYLFELAGKVDEALAPSGQAVQVPLRRMLDVGALLGGALGTLIGLRPTLWIMAVGLILAGLVLLAGPIGRIRDFPSAPALPSGA